MLILALDTTSEKGGVGIFQDAECLASAPNEGPANRFSISLFELAQQALAEARLELREIELFAVANGPGSFTGIRVGLAAARAWGKAFDRPVRGVSVLEAVVTKSNLTSAWAFPILDARRGEFYLGAFRTTSQDVSGASGRKYEPVEAGWVLRPEFVTPLVEKFLANGASATCLVRAHDNTALALRESLPASLDWQRIEGTLVDSVASLALQGLLTSSPCSDPKLDAYYIRRPDAEINWKG